MPDVKISALPEITEPTGLEEIPVAVGGANKKIKIANLPAPEMTAANIEIEDTGEHFTATDVEGALAELFTLANSGKTAIATAIGTSETPTSSTFAELAEAITDDKENLADNLVTKGVTATSAETLAMLVSKVLSIVQSGSGVDPSGATATESDVLLGKTFYAGDTTMKTGTLVPGGGDEIPAGTKPKVIAMKSMLVEPSVGSPLTITMGTIKKTGYYLLGVYTSGPSMPDYSIKINGVDTGKTLSLSGGTYGGAFNQTQGLLYIESGQEITLYTANPYTSTTFYPFLMLLAGCSEAIAG